MSKDKNAKNEKINEGAASGDAKEATKNADANSEKINQGAATDGAKEVTQNADVGSEKSKRKPIYQNKRFQIVAGVVVIIAIFGGAFWTWHEQPSFCNAICHTPMDPYVEMFNQQPNTEGFDKWGNSVENTSSMLAVAHGASKNEGGAGANCLSCHVPTISQQMTEASEFMTGNMPLFKNAKYGLVLGERNTTTLGKWLNQSGDAFCLNSGCHNLTRQDLVKATSQYGTKNPHMAMHNQQRDCSDCHKAHRASVNACSQCHDDAPIPEGWLTYEQAKAVAESD